MAPKNESDRTISALIRLTERGEISWERCQVTPNTYIASVNEALVTVTRDRISVHSEFGDQFAYRLTVMKGQGVLDCQDADVLWKTINSIGVISEYEPWLSEIEAEAAESEVEGND